MGIFNSKVEEKVIDLNRKVSGSFSLVKQDTELLFRWIDYLYNIVQQQERNIEHLNEKVLEALNNKIKTEDIKKIIDLYYSPHLNNIMDHVKFIENKVDHFERHKELEKQTLKVETQIPVEQKIIKVFEHEKNSLLKSKIIKSFTKKSKDYIKNVLVSLVQKYGSISALQLREIVVEEQSLCSRSSIYRLLEELEREQEVIVTHKGKEKVYSPKFERKTIKTPI